MGKKDSFNVGDLVFAKVKGYPAWPAKIVDITKSKKYSVYFYGTGEKANVVGKDISLYENTKHKLATNSSMKKQDFKMAIEQIEAALQGDDLAPPSYDIPLNHSNFDNTLNSTIDTSGIGANSTKIDESVADDADNGDADAESTTKDEITEIVQDDEATPDAVEENNETIISEAVANEPETNSTPAAKVEPKPVNKTEAKPEPKAEPKAEAKIDSKAETKADSKAETKADSKTDSKAESKADNKADFSRSGRKIKKTKYLHDEFEELPQVPMKRKRPSESQTPVSKIAKKTDDSGAADEGNEGEIKQVSQIIMNEVNLLQYDVDIKSSLQLSSADTSRCIAVLEKYKGLEVTALMLKKNPQVAETIKRLRRYVGNTKEWNFSDEQHLEFNEKAAKIRKLAETIYKNFKKLFTFPSNVSFWQGFTDEVQSFKEQTKSLTHEELITLTEDVQSAMNSNIEVKNSIRV